MAQVDRTRSYSTEKAGRIKSRTALCFTSSASRRSSLQSARISPRTSALARPASLPPR